ncbi:MAG: thioredoxin domain-containing protein [Ancrocorticia sp.]
MASRNTPGTSSAKLTKEERRKQAREAARLLQIEEAKRAKRNRIMVIVGVIVALALVATAVYLVLANGKKKEQSEAWDDFTPAASVFVDGTPGNVTDQGAVTFGSSLSAGTVNEGAPAVQIYFDYLCVHCNTLENEHSAELSKLAEEGKITLVLQPVGMMGDFSRIATGALYYLAENAPEQALAFNNKVFSELTAPLFDGSGATEPTAADALRVAGEVGVPADVLTGLEGVLNDGSYAGYADLAYEQEQANGMSGTPHVIIDNHKLLNWPDIMTQLDAVIAGETPWDAS